MIIDKHYIFSRIGQLLEKQMSVRNVQEKQNLSLFRRKQRLPAWLRRIVFHPLNPVYSIWKQYRHSRLPGQYPIDCFTQDFALYLFSQEPYRLDTADFVGQGDEAQVVTYLDNRLNHAMGWPWIETAGPAAGFADFQSQIVHRSGRWVLPLDGSKWLLPAELEAYGAFTHYGLDLLPEGVAAYIAGKDFIDCGAYVGDSALYMLKYRPRKIYAFEPVSTTHALLEQTIRENGLQEQVVAVKKGVGDQATTATIYVETGGSSIRHDLSGENQTEQIEISTLDEECRGMNVGVIKMDIEGFEYNAVKGALETIRRDRPVLLISIYHTGKDFFEILPMLRSLDLSYRFRFIDLSPASPLLEKMLVAYPAELE